MAGSEYYDHSTYPSNGASGSSSAMRSELDLIEAGFGKLPDLSGNGSKVVAVKSDASALEAITTTGTGSGVRATSPTLTTPVLGVATATSINKNSFTTPATSCTWTLVDGKTFTCSNTLTLAGTDGSTLNVGTGGTLGTAAYTASADYGLVASPLSQFAATTSAQLRGVISDETGSGSLVFATSPALATATISATGSTAALTITQTGSGNALVVEDSASTDSSPFVIDGDGRVLTGYASAVSCASSVTPLIQNHGDNANSSSASQVRWSASSPGPWKILAKSRGASAGTRGVVQSGDTLGLLSFQGDDGTNFIEGARIESSVDGTPGTNDMPGRLVFSTSADGSASPTERFRLDSAGILTSAATMIHGGSANTVAGVAISSLGSWAHIARSSTNSKLMVQTIGQSAESTAIGFVYGTANVGSINHTSTATTYNTSSDYRLKAEVEELSGSGQFIDAMIPRRFKWQATGEWDAGFLAHEVQAVAPRSVTGEKDAVDENGDPAFQSMQPGSSEIVANIVAEIKSLRSRVAVLESTIAANE